MRSPVFVAFGVAPPADVATLSEGEHSAMVRYANKEIRAQKAAARKGGRKLIRKSLLNGSAKPISSPKSAIKR